MVELDPLILWYSIDQGSTALEPHVALLSLCCGSLSLKICVTTANMRHPPARDLLCFSTPGRPTMKIKVSEENRMFNAMWTDSFAFTTN